MFLFWGSRRNKGLTSGTNGGPFFKNMSFCPYCSELFLSCGYCAPCHNSPAKFCKAHPCGKQPSANRDQALAHIPRLFLSSAWLARWERHKSSTCTDEALKSSLCHSMSLTIGWCSDSEARWNETRLSLYNGLSFTMSYQLRSSIQVWGVNFGANSVLFFFWLGRLHQYLTQIAERILLLDCDVGLKHLTLLQLYHRIKILLNFTSKCAN